MYTPRTFKQALDGKFIEISEEWAKRVLTGTDYELTKIVEKKQFRMFGELKWRTITSYKVNCGVTVIAKGTLREVVEQLYKMVYVTVFHGVSEYYISLFDVREYVAFQTDKNKIHWTFYITDNRRKYDIVLSKVDSERVGKLLDLIHGSSIVGAYYEKSATE